MAKRSFFGDMRFIEAKILRHEVSEQGQEVFYKLVSFVEDCEFTQSKSYKFISRNWREGYNELEQQWVAEGNKPKRQSCFRVQLSCLSQMMYSLFPRFSREAFVYDDGDAFKDIKAVITTIEHFQAYPQFIREVYEHSDTASYLGDVKASDCLETMKKLKPLLRSGVVKYLNGLDMNKVKYILSTLQSPLFSTYSAECNTEKLALLQALWESDARLEQDKHNKDAVVREVKVEVPERTPYNLSISKKLADLLTAHASATMTIDETKKYLKLSETEQNARKKRLAKILCLFTGDGLERLLSQFYSIEIDEVLNGIYPTDEGEQAYKFRR